MTNELNLYYIKDINNIKKFLSERPKVVGCYCYGIGETFGAKIYKLILVSDDIWKWQLFNSKKNECTDYMNFLYNSGYNFVEFIGIRENNCIFDYTLMSEKELIDNLQNWKFFTYAEIFQRPFITVVSNDLIDKKISYNQKLALTTSLLMPNRDRHSFFELMLKLYCISGCISSEKIDLVNENYYMLMKIYSKFGLIDFNESEGLIVNFDDLNQEILSLPNIIKKFLCEYNGNTEIIGINYFYENKIIDEQQKINLMKYLVNGPFRFFYQNGRSHKTKFLKREDIN